jgi:ubiquinone/menaquinone biosynthesis C-methylase UbiE
MLVLLLLAVSLPAASLAVRPPPPSPLATTVRTAGSPPPAPLSTIAGGAAPAQESVREQWQRVPEVLAALGIGPGSHVADVGSGDGFFSVRLARAVGATGRVYAVDISAEALSRLRARLERENIDNVEVIEGEPDDPRLPEAALDAALIVNAYHEMVDYPAMLAHLRRALKPEGRLVIVEPITSRMRAAPRALQVDEHEIAPWFVETELREAGFHVLQLVDPFTTRPMSGGQFQDSLVVALPELPVQPAGAMARAPAVVAAEPAAGPAAEEPDDLRITVAAFDELAGEDGAVLIDVRPPAAFAQGHLPGARSVPLDEIEDHAAELAAEGRAIVAYCD